VVEPSVCVVAQGSKELWQALADETDENRFGPIYHLEHAFWDTSCHSLCDWSLDA